MRVSRFMIAALGMMLSAGPAWAEDGAGGEQTLTGEVMDVMCYVSHGKEGSGKEHATCGTACINKGLPVAIKSGDVLYLASMADHTPANAKLAEFAGRHVTVRGTVAERDGQRLIAITDIQPAQ